MAKQSENFGAEFDCPIDAINFNAEFNARRDYENHSNPDYDNKSVTENKAGSLDDLMASLKRDGQLQAIVVRRGKKDKDTWDIIIGFRRYLAAKKLGWATIKARPWAGEEVDAHLINLTENIDREDLTAYEVAAKCEWLTEKYDMSAEKVASRVNLSRSYVSALIQCIKSLHPDILKAWRSGNKACKTDDMRKWSKLSKDEQLEQFRAATGTKEGSGKEGSKDGASNGAGAGGAGGAGGSPAAPTMRRATEEQLAAAIEAVKSLPRDKQPTYNAVGALVYALEFASGKRQDIPGVYSKPEKAPKGRKTADCPKCGKKSGGVFCEHCGARVKSEAQA